MSNSLLDLSARTDLDWLAALLADAQIAAPDSHWLIVGALARDLHLSYGHGIRVDRATTDTDLALSIADWTQFSNMHDQLVRSGLFVSDQRVQHRLAHRSGRSIDVVPFGGVADANNIVAWPPSGEIKMSVTGYREAFGGSIELKLTHNVGTRLVSIAGLILLKFMAWSERHLASPGKDAYDLRVLLRHYLDAGNVERLYEDHADLVTANFDYANTGARLAGRDTGNLLALHSANPKHLGEQLNALVAEQSHPEGSRVLIGQSGRDPELMRLLLTSFLIGFNENRFT